MREVNKINRREILHGNKNTSTNKRIPFVTVFNEASPYISRIINRRWGIIKESFPKMSQFQQPPRMSYRRASNLRDRLVKTEVPPKTSAQQFLTKRK